ncbi:hypothetical protein CG724_12755 [Streptomyces sp. CB02120-2]|nr:hypothetical protein CG724_12755 [Streptomyces sp. CB02120-2]
MPGPPSPLPSLPTRGGGNVSPRCYLNVPLGGTDPGHRPMDDRAALRAIVYVLCKSVGWRDVPAEQVGCSGRTWTWTTRRSTLRTSGPSKGGG